MKQDNSSTSVLGCQPRLKSRRLGESAVAVWLERPQIQTEWDIDQVLAKGTTLIISGNTGMGKSWESKHLAIQSKLGGKWHNLQCRQLRPLYISLEFTDNQMQKRVEKLARVYSKDLDAIADVEFLARKGSNFKLNTEEGKENLFNELRKHKFEVLILDPLALFIGGKLTDVDWNNKVEPVLNEIKKEFGCSIVLNHNFRKTQYVYGHSEDMFSADRLKGLADIIDRADSIITFVAENQPRKIGDKSQRIIVAKWICAPKTRDAEWELSPHRVQWDYNKAMFVTDNDLGWTPPVKAKRHR